MSKGSVIKSSQSGTTPHFFCESCGAEVKRNAKSCPECGSAFGSVRCPACDFIGEETLFKNGCPSCGYSSGADQEPGQRQLDFPDIPPEIKKPAGALPPWVYILTAAAFTAILAALFFTIIR